MCSACERGKSKKSSHPPNVVPISTACFTQNQSIIHTRYNKTPYELLHDKKPNVEYFHVFGSLCYRTNDREDLGMMKPKADIGIFIGYSKSYRGFQIYNRHTKEIMETIHVKFDELTTMASEHDSLEPVSQQFINDDSSAESMNTPSKEDLDNLFGPMYDKYFKKRSFDVSINFVAQQVHSHEDSHLTSLIIVEEHKAPPIVTTSEEQTSPISLNEANEFNQEDSADFNVNTVFIPYDAPNFKEVESSTTALDPSNMHEFHQEKGIDFEESFAPIAHIEAVRMVVTFATHKNIIVFQPLLAKFK
nr:retrovirus-related Pol polyprotein from transposon TNT 1-94 [Tanacetum cinerariifolium]